MKRTKSAVYSILMVLFLFMGINSSIAARVDPVNGPSIKERVASMTPAERETRWQQMKARVAEIKAMDKSQLTRQDKKALRHELRDMNTESRAMDHGTIYISLGAALIIILLVILIVR